MDDQAIEQEIQAKGKTAPRVTPADIEAAIDGEFSFTVGNAARALNCPVSVATDLLTICVLTLRNGFTVTGESACASLENFDAEIGRKIARGNAAQKIWMLEGYLLKQRLHDEACEYALLHGEVAETAPASTLPPHQQRVIDERTELDDKLSKLVGFFSSPLFEKLPGAEKARMRTQAALMGTYSEILAERIAAF